MGLVTALLNPSIALMLAAAFATLWFYQRPSRYLAALAFGYLLSAVGFLLQYFELPIGFYPTKLVSNIAFIAGTACLALAVSARYTARPPYIAVGILSTIGLSLLLWFLFVDPDLSWRIYAMNFSLGGITLYVTAQMYRMPGRGPLETALVVLAFVIGLNFIARTFVVLSLQDGPVTYENLYQSAYWMSAVFTHALLSLMLALVLLAGAGLDVVSGLKTDSHTDPLSRLLNRRGFEERAMRLLDRCGRTGLPVVLVLADLDHFKTVNDIYGHQAGDRVIVDFARRLQAAAGSRALVARLGGEEFAMLLPSTDLSAACLCVEAIRTGFAAGDIDGLPPGKRITASFGIAAHTCGESLAPLTRRTDDALYKAKRSGRDSIRLSYQRPAASPLPAQPMPLVMADLPSR